MRDQDDDNRNVEEIDIEEIHISHDGSSSLSLTRLPWSLWGLTIIFFFGGSFLLANLIDQKKVFNKFYEGYWWQYLVIIIMYMIGVLIFLCGKIEVVCFDKETGLMTTNKWILCYKWRGIATSLSDVVNVTLQKEGVKNTYQDSIHYKVLIILRQAAPMRILETKSRTRAIEKVKQIRKFFGLSMLFQIIDASTS